LGDVLFIIPDNYQEDNHFNMGMGYLSAFLREAGADVNVYCMDIYHYSNEDLAGHLEDNPYSLIGTGFLAARYKETIEPLLSAIGRYKKNAQLIIGGHCASAIPEYMLEQNPAVDVVCVGEAEKTIIDLWNAKQLSKIKGIAYREDGGIVTNERRPPIKDLDSIPFPAYDLFPMDIYTSVLKFSAMRKDDKAFSILTSRGCPFNCSFCHRLEKSLRLRSLKNVVVEMKLLNERYGVTYFNMNDEYFLLSKKRLYEFKDELERNDLKIRFETNARVDTFDEEKAKLLKNIGCTFLNFGFESMDQKVLDLMNKKTKVAQNQKAAEIANKVGISAGLNFIWGCPGDTEETLRKNVDFIKTYTTDYSQIRTVRFLTPYPGSPIYYQAIRGGRLKGASDFFRRFKNSDLITVNYMDGIPYSKAYEMMMLANYELIMDYQQHTDMQKEEAEHLIESFRRLYFNFDYKFRGARHYEKRGI